jgi:hypothetical protein
MATINAACKACGTYAPAAMLATIGNTRQFALCRTCADTPAAVRAFAAQFNRDCRDDDPVLAANQYLGGQAIDAAPAAR